MQTRWSPDAVNDLERIVEFIRQDNPSAAERIGRDVYNRALRLGSFPYGGREGRVYGTRELALPPLPYIIVYRVLRTSIRWRLSI